MRRDQAADDVFLQIGIEATQKIGDVIGIGFQAGKRGMLPACIARDSDF